MYSNETCLFFTYLTICNYFLIIIIFWSL
jgi:hypothetical protein